MDNLKNELRRQGISQKQLAIMMRVSQPTVSDWVSGKIKPSHFNLLKLSELLGVSVDYLLGRDDSAATKKEAALEMDDFTYALYGESRHLSDADKEQLLNMARFLRQQQEAKNGKNGKSD